MKRLFILFSIFVLFTVMVIPVNAFEQDASPVVDEESYEFGGVIGSKLTEYYDDPENRPTYGERFAAGMIISFVNGMFHWLGMQDVNALVFNKKIETHNDFLVDVDATEGKVFGTFPVALFNAVMLIYQVYEKLFPIPLVLAVALLGLYLIFFGGSQETRTKVKDYALAFVVAILSMSFGFYIFHGLFALNTYFVDLIWYKLDDAGIKLGAFLDTIWGNGHNNYKQFMSIQSLGIAIIMFFAMLMTAILNYQYMLRLIMLSVLIVTFPIANFLSVFPRFRHSLTTWWQEFIANTFIQTAHAIALGLFYLMLHYMGEGGLSFWLVWAYFFGLPTIVAFFRRLIGLGEGNSFMGTVSAMAGVAAIMSASRMFRARDNQPTDERGGHRGTERERESTHTDNTRQTSPLMNRQSIPKRVLSNKWVRRGTMTAGATMGAVMSTMAVGNPIIGMVGGAGAGSLVSRAGAKAGNMYDDLKQFSSDVKQEMQEQQSSSSSPLQGSPLLPQSRTQQALDKGKNMLRATGEVMQQRYVSGKGGAITNAAVGTAYGLSSGLKTAKDMAKVSLNRAMIAGSKIDNYLVGKGYTTDIQPVPQPQPHPRTSFVEQQNQIYDTATKNMQEIEPQLNLAKTHFQEMQAKYGQGSEWYNQTIQRYNLKDNPQAIRSLLPDEYRQAETKYLKLNEDYNRNKRMAMEAKMNLTDHNRIMQAIRPLQQKGQFTQGRGRL